MEPADDTNGQDDRDLGDEIAANESSPAGFKKLAILLLAGSLILCLLHFTPLGDSLKDFQHLRHAKDGSLGEAAIKFFLLCTILTAVGVPRLMLSGIAGLVLGFWVGLATSLLGSLAGSFATFWVVRWSGGEWARKRFANRGWFAKIAGVRPSVWSVCMIRQLPVSNVFINSCLALSRTHAPTFLIGSLVGFLPQGAVATLIGSGSSNGTAWKGAAQLASAAIVLLCLLPWLWRHLFRKSAQEKSAPSVRDLR